MTLFICCLVGSPAVAGSDHIWTRISICLIYRRERMILNDKKKLMNSIMSFTSPEIWFFLLNLHHPLIQWLKVLNRSCSDTKYLSDSIQPTCALFQDGYRSVCVLTLKNYLLPFAFSITIAICRSLASYLLCVHCKGNLTLKPSYFKLGLVVTQI